MKTKQTNKNRMSNLLTSKTKSNHFRFKIKAYIEIAQLNQNVCFHGKMGAKIVLNIISFTSQ